MFIYQNYTKVNDKENRHKKRYKPSKLKLERTKTEIIDVQDKRYKT